MAFLIAAGCSGNLPSARWVIASLVEGVTAGLHGIDDRLRPTLFHRLQQVGRFGTHRTSDLLDRQVAQALARLQGKQDVAVGRMPELEMAMLTRLDLMALSLQEAPHVPRRVIDVSVKPFSFPMSLPANHRVVAASGRARHVRSG